MQDNKDTPIGCMTPIGCGFILLTPQ